MGADGKQLLRFFGNPFRCISKKGETISVFAERIKKRMGLTTEQMQNWRFVVVAYKDKTFLEKDDCLSDHQFHSHTHLVLPRQQKRIRSFSIRKRKANQNLQLNKVLMFAKIK